MLSEKIFLFRDGERVRVGVEEAAAMRWRLLEAVVVGGGSPAASTRQLAGGLEPPICLPPPPCPHPTVSMGVPGGEALLGGAAEGGNLRRAESSGGLPGGEGGWLEEVQA